MRQDDPAVVRGEYASDARLAARIAAHRFGEGPDAREMAFQAVAESAPQRVLEVGCGRGEMAERIQRELGAVVIAVDQSEHMVELTRARGVHAHVGDVQKLSFPDGSFDCALAAWMLYHVPDVPRALGELARVLRPGGRLVAVTNGPEHIHELIELLGDALEPPTFNGANAEELLQRHFACVERRDAYGSIVFPGREEAQAYIDSTILLARMGTGQLPRFEGPLHVTRAPVVLVAEKAR